jgi:hypothetical protein
LNLTVCQPAEEVAKFYLRPGPHGDGRRLTNDDLHTDPEILTGESAHGCLGRFMGFRRTAWKPPSRRLRLTLCAYDEHGVVVTLDQSNGNDRSAAA